MNVKSIIALGLGVATIGLSLPAFADSSDIVTTEQSAIVTGNGNYGSQDSKTSIRNYEHRNKDSRGSDTVTKQNMDVAGDHNDTRQKSRTELTNIRNRNK
jgi:hypothetical protein